MKKDKKVETPSSLLDLTAKQCRDEWLKTKELIEKPRPTAVDLLPQFKSAMEIMDEVRLERAAEWKALQLGVTTPLAVLSSNEDLAETVNKTSVASMLAAESQKVELLPKLFEIMPARDIIKETLELQSRSMRELIESDIRDHQSLITEIKGSAVSWLGRSFENDATAERGRVEKGAPIQNPPEREKIPNDNANLPANNVGDDQLSRLLDTLRTARPDLRDMAITAVNQLKGAVDKRDIDSTVDHAILVGVISGIYYSLTGMELFGVKGEEEIEKFKKIVDEMSPPKGPNLPKDHYETIGSMSAQKRDCLIDGLVALAKRLKKVLSAGALEKYLRNQAKMTVVIDSDNCQKIWRVRSGVLGYRYRNRKTNSWRDEEIKFSSLSSHLKVVKQRINS